MSFVEKLSNLDSKYEISSNLSLFKKLLSPTSLENIDKLAKRTVSITRRNFGNTINLFSPIYLSNECINNCSYCGFSRDNPILRTTLSVNQFIKEVEFLYNKGFRNLLLVAGEHPKFISNGYLEECINAISSKIPSIGLEIAPMEVKEYEKIVSLGCEYLIVYQESYIKNEYKKYHTAGPKKNFEWRLEAPQRAYKAGFRRIGIGALIGLSEWREEVFRLAYHLEYLYKYCWKSQFTISLPRLRPCAGDFSPSHMMSDLEFFQTICAFRICFPNVGIILSTRESEKFRDLILPIGITHASAGSNTSPGGYTGEGIEDLHTTVNGRKIPINQKEYSKEELISTNQFDISDKRTPSQISDYLKSINIDSVWKNWETSILSKS